VGATEEILGQFLGDDAFPVLAEAINFPFPA
jgi:hypothetical protein